MALLGAEIDALPPGAERYAPSCAPAWVDWIRDGYPQGLSFDDWQKWRDEVDLVNTSNSQLALLGLADRWFLFTELMGRQDVYRFGYASAKWLYLRCRDVERAPDGHLDLWARGHYKSSLITICGTIQEVLRNPEITVLILSHTKTQAQKFLSAIMVELATNERLKEIYSDVLYEDPAKEALRWGVQDGIVVKREGNPKESTIDAGGMIEGMPVGGHWDLREYDDIITPSAVTSPEMIAKVTDRFDHSQHLKSRGGRMQMIGTRYNFGDTYQTLLTRGIVFPRVYPATANGRLDGKPVFLSEAEWEKEKRGAPSTVAAQMLQNPLAGSETVFDPELLKSYEIRPLTLNVFMLVDPSKGSHRTSDRTAIAVIGIDAAGNKYLLDGFRHRMNLLERWTNLKALHGKWKRQPGVKSVRVGYERYGMQSDLEVLRDYMQREEYLIQIDEVAWPREGGHSKSDRVERLVPDVERGRFKLPAFIHDPVVGKCSWSFVNGSLDLKPLVGKTKAETLAEDAGHGVLVVPPIKRMDEEKRLYDLTRALIEEMLYFPYGEHDDLVDAVSRIYDMAPAKPRFVSKRDLVPEHFPDF